MDLFFIELVTKYLTAPEDEKPEVEDKLKEILPALKNTVQEIKKQK